MRLCEHLCVTEWETGLYFLWWLIILRRAILKDHIFSLLGHNVIHDCLHVSTGPVATASLRKVSECLTKNPGVSRAECTTRKVWPS